MPSAAKHHQPLSTMRWIERASCCQLFFCYPGAPSPHMPANLSSFVTCQLPRAYLHAYTYKRAHTHTHTHSVTHTHRQCCKHTRIAFQPLQLLHLLTPFNSCNQLTRTSSTEGSSGPCRLCIPIVSVSHHYSPRSWYALCSLNTHTQREKHQPLSTIRWIECASCSFAIFVHPPLYACELVKLCHVPVAQSMLIVTLTRIYLETNTQTHTHTPAAFTNKQTAFRLQLLHLLSPLNSCNQLTRTSSTEGSSGPCRLCIPSVSVSHHYSPRCWYAMRSETSSASVDHAMERTCQLLPAVLLLSWCTLPSYACQLVKLCDIPVTQSMLVVTLTRIHIQTRAHTQCHTHTRMLQTHTDRVSTSATASSAYPIQQLQSADTHIFH